MGSVLQQKEINNYAKETQGSEGEIGHLHVSTLSQLGLKPQSLYNPIRNPGVKI